MGDPALRRIAHFQNCELAISQCHRFDVLTAISLAHFSLFAPKLYNEYRTTLGKLYTRYPTLKRNFPGSVYPAASINFGPNSVSFGHADHGNRAAGLCSIFAAGQFNHKRGGHIFLEQLQLVVEFPSGSNILIPSATCVHGNTPIQPGETRTSFTQYAAGGLFRFVDYGFRSWKKLKSEDPKLAKELEEKQDDRWAEQIKLWSCVGELHADRVASGFVTTSNSM